MFLSPLKYFHPSNVATYVALLLGLLAMTAASELGSRALAGGLIALSVLVDTVDGWFARQFHRDSDLKRFGIQLDSLVDTVSFGLAPVACAYLLAPSEPAGPGWLWFAAAFVYLVCAITRLGFHSLHHGQTSGFIGIPAPVAGLIWSSYFLGPGSNAVSLGLLIVCGIAMVIPVRVPRPKRLGLLAFNGWSLALITAHLLALSEGIGPGP